MAVISDSGLEREVLRHIVPRRAISVPRLTRRIPGVLTLIPVVVDCLSIAVAYLLVGIVDPIPASAIVVLCLLLAGTYRRRLTLSGLDIAPAVVVAASAGAILSSTVNGANGIRDLVVPVGAACVAVFTGRVVACSLTRRLRRLTALRSRVVVVGADPVGIALTQRILEEPEYGLEPVLVIDDEAVVTNVASQRVPLRAAQSTTELLLSAEPDRHGGDGIPSP
ncbi:hypothetical protein H7I76_09120 [Mycolicibacterium vaccae]|nr:hypothetical protein [Mycolicibacterium vaccae]